MFNPTILIGCPGAGKTTALLDMVDEELEAGVPPERIGFLTFTRRAAEEARNRACERFGFAKTRLPYFRTIHSLCFAALGLTSSDVLTGNKLKDFGEWIGAPVSASLNFEEGSMAGFELGDRCLHINNLARVKGLSLRQQYDLNCDDLDWHLVERVARGLEEYKRQKHLIDFTHMLQLFVDSDWRARIDVLYVDEAQDLSLLQWRVIEKLAWHAQRLVIAGDDDQSIFRWAGAAVDHFVRLPGQVKVLGQSWRVPQAIQGLAHEVIGRVRARRPKQWAPRPEAGRVRRVQSLDEVDLGTGDDVLVLSRNSAYLRKEAANLLRSEGVLYSYRGEQSVKPELVQAILDWEHLRKGDTVPVRQAERIYEYMGVGTSIQKGFKKLPQHQDREAEVSILDLQNRAGLQTTGIWHEAMDRLPAEDRAYMIKALKRGEKFTRNPTVRLSTIHGSKGGEANHVVLVRDMAFRTYKEMEQSPEDEARCFYVAATRAKQTLTIVAPQTKRSYDI